MMRIDQGRFVSLAAGFLVVGSALLPTAAAQQGLQGRVEPKTGTKFREAFRPVIAKAAKSTVRIFCVDKETGNGKEVALGVVVAQDGYVLTKYSDLSGRIMVQLRSGAEHEARLVGVQAQHDLAMLKINVNGLTPVEWTDSKADAVGNFVASVGMNDLPVAVGVISVAARKVQGGDGGVANPNSGFLGIELATDFRGKGAKVDKVAPKSAAQKANIKPDDVIVAIGSKSIDSMDALKDTLSHTRPGDSVTVKLFRGSEQIELQVTLAKRVDTPNRADMQNNMGSKLSSRKTGFPVILQHDSVVRPEDCGGPLVDLEGRVIAVNIARAGRVETDAIPAEVIRPLLSELMSGKLAPKTQ
jgi:serine protease Do